ncbi:MAG: hypothetical protein ACTHLH_02590 [Solirubrobacterales bacterium]
MNSVKAPVEAASTYSQSAAGSTSEAAAKASAGTTPAVEGAANEAAEPAATETSSSARASTPGASAHSPETRQGEHEGPESRGPQTPVKATPVDWLLAYVWPAVALGRDQGLLATFAAELRAVPLSDILKAVEMPLGPGGETEAGNSLPSPQGHLDKPESSSAAHSLRTALGTGATTIFYAAVAALLAVFAFAVGAELRAAIRSRSTTDRWHQGL